MPSGSNRSRLGDLLATPATPPTIRRGQGFGLSTDPVPTAPVETSANAQAPERSGAETPVSVDAQEHIGGRADVPERTDAQKPERSDVKRRKRTTALTATPQPASELVRVSQGFRIRADLIKRCRIVAAQQDRKMYELLEEALTGYLDRIDRVEGRAPKR